MGEEERARERKEEEEERKREKPGSDSRIFLGSLACTLAKAAAYTVKKPCGESSMVRKQPAEKKPRRSRAAASSSSSSSSSAPLPCSFLRAARSSMSRCPSYHLRSWSSESTSYACCASWKRTAAPSGSSGFWGRRRESRRRKRRTSLCGESTETKEGKTWSEKREEGCESE